QCFRRKENARLCQLIRGALFYEFGVWREPRLQPCILTKPGQCGGTTVCGDLIIQEYFDAFKHRLTWIKGGYQVFLHEVVHPKLEIEGPLQDVQVLLNVLISDLRTSHFERPENRFQFPTLGQLIGQAWIGNLRVKTSEPFRRSLFGRMFELDVKKQARVAVALLDPCLPGSLGRARE